MWSVDKDVERFEGKNVNWTYPQNRSLQRKFLRLFIHEKNERVLRV
jgi:hypothetical protein